MSEKEIEPTDIRKGDVIQWEANIATPAKIREQVVTYVARQDKDWWDVSGVHLLLERRQSRSELRFGWFPNGPGILETGNDYINAWYPNEHGLFHNAGTWVRKDELFVEAVLVPKAHWEKLAANSDMTVPLMGDRAKGQAFRLANVANDVVRATRQANGDGFDD